MSIKTIVSVILYNSFFEYTAKKNWSIVKEKKTEIKGKEKK